MPEATRAALIVSCASVGWSTVTGVASVRIGLSAGSLGLIGAGCALLLDLASSLVLVWRFLHPRGHAAAEHRAHQVAASALLSLGLLLGGSSVYRLVSGGRAHPTTVALTIAAASLIVLPLLAARKYVVAQRVPSRALVTDAHITVVGAATAFLTMIGLVLTERGLFAADAIAALLIAAAAASVGLAGLRSGQ